MSAPARPKGVTSSGWACILLGALTVVSSLLSALVLAFVDVGQIESILDEFSGGVSDLGPIMEYALPLSILQAILGALLVVAGIGFLRLRAWARTFLEVFSWITIAWTIATTPWWFRPLMDLREETGSAEAPQTRNLLILAMVITAIFYVLQIVLLALFIRYLRRPALRAAFTKRPAPTGPA